MTHPKASFVVPSRGGAGRLPHLFEALKLQTESSWEAIVVLDGDIDDSESVVAVAAAEGLPVRSIVFPENRGRSAALNAGFADARGEVFIRCDDDLRPRENYVAASIKRHEQSAGPIGVIGLYQNVYPETAYSRAYGLGRDIRFRQEAYATASDRTWRFWCGNVSVTQATYKQVGDYDLAFRAYGWEDIDWGYRLHENGAKIILAEELETPHHVAAVTTEIRVKRAFHAGAARLTFDSKHGEGASGSYDKGKGLWDRIVSFTARKDLENLLNAARRLDGNLDKMTPWVAEKRVSLLVEAAAISGLVHPDQVSMDV